MRYGQLALAAAVLCGGLHSAAQAQITVFDSSARSYTQTTFRAAEFDPATFISSVASNTVINAFSIENQMVSAGNLKFLIYDQTTATFVYTSAPKAFGADSGPTFKQSDPFTLTLLAGHQYDIGTIADVSANYPFGVFGTDFTQNGITSHSTNGNFTGFNSPTFSGNAGADLPLKLFQNSAVPEPGSIALLSGLGVTGSLFAVHRLRRRQK